LEHDLGNDKIISSENNNKSEKNTIKIEKDANYKI
jgi:hypothetical protein